MPQPVAILVLADEPIKAYTPQQRHAAKEWAMLTGGLILGAMLIAGIVLVILGRHKRLALRPVGPEARKKKPKVLPNAWEESAKRLDPDKAGSRDDTVDIDPDELGPHDVDGGPGEPGGTGGSGGESWR